MLPELTRRTAKVRDRAAPGPLEERVPGKAALAAFMRVPEIRCGLEPERSDLVSRMIPQVSTAR